VEGGGPFSSFSDCSQGPYPVSISEIWHIEENYSERWPLCAGGGGRPFVRGTEKVWSEGRGRPHFS